MELLVDSGNSRLKWAVLERGVIGPARSAPGGRELTPAQLDRLWGELPVPDRVWIANVAGESVAACLERWLRSRWGKTGTFVCSQREACGVRSGYRDPRKLGVDRWLALIAARHHHPLPACIVDCGTALTLDVLDNDGRHHGGLICPGAALMRRSLGQGTAQVEAEEHETDALLGDHTAAAVTLGVEAALAGLVERSLARLAPRWPDLHLVLTGGDAIRLARNLSRPAQLAPDLVLRGLALVSRQV